MNSRPVLDSNQPLLEAQCRFGGLRFEELTYPTTLGLPTHAHPAAYMELCLAGMTRNFWGKENLVCGPASVNFFPIGAPHAVCFSPNTRTFQIMMDASWLERVGQVAPLVDTLTSYQDGAPTWIAARLYREFQRRDDLTPLVLQGLLLELLAEMSRATKSRTEPDCPRWLHQTKEFLHAHFTESVSVERLAAVVGIHPSHLMRGFRQHFRCTIGEYVRKLRVDYACYLLSTSEMPLAQIAAAIGFADQSHFTHTFKRCMRMTPVEFQKVSGRASFRQETIR